MRARSWRTLAATTVVALAAVGASISSAQAVCDQTINSTSGATITFTSVTQVYRLCLTVVATANTGDDAAIYGLYSVSGTNAAVNFPIAGTSASGFTNYNSTTAKASYTLVPSSANDNGQNANTGNAQINITLNSMSGSGQDTITLYYASDCSDRLAACSGSGTAIVPWVLTINLPGPTATQAIASKALTVNTAAATSFTPVTGSGGTAPLGFGIAPALPAGLAFNTSTGAITGTPTATSAATTYTVTVTDANSATASNTFSLAINGAVTATQAVASKTLTQNQPSTNFTPVTGGGGSPAYTYGVSPSLPSGLSFNTSTGAITGTPTRHERIGDLYGHRDGLEQRDSLQHVQSRHQLGRDRDPIGRFEDADAECGGDLVYTGHRRERHAITDLQRLAIAAGRPDSQQRHRCHHGHADREQRRDHLHGHRHRCQQRHCQQHVQPDGEHRGDGDAIGGLGHSHREHGDYDVHPGDGRRRDSIIVLCDLADAADRPSASTPATARSAARRP